MVEVSFRYVYKGITGVRKCCWVGRRRGKRGQNSGTTRGVMLTPRGKDESNPDNLPERRAMVGEDEGTGDTVCTKNCPCWPGKRAERGRGRGRG